MAKAREMNASTFTDVNDCSIMELDNSRVVGSGDSKQSRDTPMTDTEESAI